MSPGHRKESTSLPSSPPPQTSGEWCRKSFPIHFSGDVFDAIGHWCVLWAPGLASLINLLWWAVSYLTSDLKHVFFWTFVAIFKGGEMPGLWKTEFCICPQMFSHVQYKERTSKNPNLLSRLSGCPSVVARLPRSFKLAWAIVSDPPDCRRRDVARLFHWGHPPNNMGAPRPHQLAHFGVCVAFPRWVTLNSMVW